MSWIFGLYLLNTGFMIIMMIREVRRPAVALNWIAISFIFPAIGFVLYLITSNPVRMNRRKKPTSTSNESDTLPDSFSNSAKVIAQTLKHMSVGGLRSGQVQVLINGMKTYERLMKSIQNAKKTIDLEYYIYKDDQIGRRITDLLIARSLDGVHIRFIRDGWGSRKLSKTQISRMMDAGIECRTIFPLRPPWVFSTLNNRDHCKIVLIDGGEAFTGGINIGDDYAGLNPNIGFWRDTHVRIAGKASSDLNHIFEDHWNIASPEQIKSKTRMKTRTGKDGSPLNTTISLPKPFTMMTEWSAELATIQETNANKDPGSEKMNQAYVHTVEGNPGIPTPFIREAYFIGITQATKTIDITTPYFVPDQDIIMGLKTAVKRGVRVRLLVPREVDQKIVERASFTYYGELLEAGVQIFLYNKGMLHAKTMVIDGEVAEVGAANYDMRSFRLNYEVSEFFYSNDVAIELTQQFEQDLQDSVSLKVEDILQRSPSQRLMQQGARLLFPLL
ncbi:cardiolipin synthase [Heyndrickxia shackletonii]|uniref:Cardiolipin synthase n=1 Tax=Heyndrickxia shackletonii TaxID=157838 RepID=A0A0Q3WW50_9BACI|nr:phospholipase D-like domain-containing protein [Heyndrickxia shackletonii]KQL53123.1 cardiolipin synthase [Heyndrickxia shackletonii]MBB2482810.1 cardiolipin synthase [Bacillus sp. APMAM]NEZ01898.1 cardiolipin synthase [Heyndrickxia shackletonii]RTZ53759.1 cardiolipin synthase [Bacillus sp. SAJ1]